MSCSPEFAVPEFRHASVSSASTSAFNSLATRAMSWSATAGSSANVRRSASSRSSANRASASSSRTFKVGSMTRQMRRSSNTARSTSGLGVFADCTIARRYPYACGSKRLFCARSRTRSVVATSTSRQNAAPSSSATAAATAADASPAPLGDASELLITPSLTTTPFVDEKAFACAALAPAAPAGPAAQVSARANPARLSFPRKDASAKTSSIRHASTHRSARSSAACSSSVRGASTPLLPNPTPPNRPSGPSRLSSCEKPRRSDEPPLAPFFCLRAASRRDRSASANDVEVRRSSIGPPSRASTSSPLRTFSESKSRRCIRSTKSTRGHHPPRTTSP